MENDQLKKYYEYLRDAKADIPPTYESFELTLSDEASAKQYHKYLRDAKFDAPDTFESFSETLGLKKKVASEYSYPTSKAFTESTPENNGSIAKDEATTPTERGALDVPTETPKEVIPDTPKEEVVKPTVYDEGYSALTDATIKGTHASGEPVTAENYITAAPQAFNQRFGEAVRNLGELVNLPQNTLAYYINKIGGKNASASIKYLEQAFKDMPGIGAFSKENIDNLATAIENAGNPKAIPETLGGSVLSTLGSVAFDIATVRSMTTSKINALAKYGMERVPMFPTYLATMQGATAKREGGGIGKTSLATAEGLAAGLTYESMGITSGRFGEMAQKLAGGRVGKVFVEGAVKEVVTGKALAKTSASALANSALFEGDSRIKGGEKWTGAITGFIFSAPEFKQDVTNIVKQSVAKRAYVSYLTTTDNAIRNISKMNLDPVELRKRSDELWDLYEKDSVGSEMTKEEILAEKTVVDNMINVNAMTQAIIENPTAFLNEIKKDQRLSDAEKAKWTEKIRKTVNFADPRIDEAMPIWDKIADLKQSVKDAETLYPDENVRNEKVTIIEEQIKEQEKLASKTLSRPLGAQPKYEMGDKSIEKDEALNLIKQAENVEDLEGMKIQNDSAVEKALEDKFGEEAMAKKAEEEKYKGLSAQERNGVKFAEALPDIMNKAFESQKPFKEAFLKRKGITEDEFNKLPQSEKDKFQEEWGNSQELKDLNESIKKSETAPKEEVKAQAPEDIAKENDLEYQGTQNDADGKPMLDTYMRKDNQANFSVPVGSDVATVKAEMEAKKDVKTPNIEEMQKIADEKSGEKDPSQMTIEEFAVWNEKQSMTNDIEIKKKALEEAKKNLQRSLPHQKDKFAKEVTILEKRIGEMQSKLDTTSEKEWEDLSNVKTYPKLIEDKQKAYIEDNKSKEPPVTETKIEPVPEVVKDETVKAVTKKLDKQSAIKEDKIFKEQKNQLLDDLISAEDILLGQNKETTRKMEEELRKNGMSEDQIDKAIQQEYQHTLDNIPKDIQDQLETKGIKVRDGKLVVDIYKDGTVEVGDIRTALRIIDKGFPTRLKEQRYTTGPSKTKDGADAYMSFKDAENAFKMAEENLNQAEKHGTPGLKKLMKERYDEAVKMHEDAKTYDYDTKQKQAKMESDKEFTDLWEANKDQFNYDNLYRENLFDIINKQGRPEKLTYDTVQPLVIKDRLETEKKTIPEKRKELTDKLKSSEDELKTKFGRVDGNGLKKPKNNNEEWQMRRMKNEIDKNKSDLEDLNKYEPAIKKLNEKTETVKQPDTKVITGEGDKLSGRTEADVKPVKTEGKTEPIATESKVETPVKETPITEKKAELVEGSHFTNSRGERFENGEEVTYNGEKAKLSIPEGLAPGLSIDGKVKPMTIAEMDKMQKLSPEDMAKKPTKEELLKVKEEEIKSKIAKNIEDLMSSLGGVQKFTEEQRPGVVKSLVELMNNLGELTLLKGEQLWDRVKQELKSKGVSIPDDLFKEAQNTYSKGREGETGDEKYRKTQINALIQDRTLQQQTVAEIVNANKEKYTVLHSEEAIAQANKLIEEKGVQGATVDLIERTRNMELFPIRQVARQVLLDFYSRAIIDKNATEADKSLAFKYIDSLQQITAREATKAGQGSAMLHIWKSMQPAGLLEYVKRKIEQGNNRILDKRIGDTTVGKQIDELYNTLTSESKKVIDDILAGRSFNIVRDVKQPIKTEPKPRTKSYTERIKKEQDYRKNIKEQYRKANAGTMALSITGLNSAQIELGGNLLGSYVRETNYRVRDVIDKLISDFKDLNINLTEEQARGLLAERKDKKETYGEYLDRKESAKRIREGENLIDKKIASVIKEHWSEKDELKRTLADKLVDEAGLIEAEAKREADKFLKDFDKKVLELSQKSLTKILGTSKIPVEKNKKGIMDKMIELVNMGAMDEGMYRDLFADKFNLTKLSQKNSEDILRLADNVQQAGGKGWLERDATIKLAKYIYELYPTKKSSEFMDTWIAMAYSNMLSGPFTSVLNLWSAGSNMILKPIRDVSNLSKWLKLIKSGVKGEGDIYNPFGEMIYSPMLRGVAHGWNEAKEVYINGDLNNKYMEEIAKKNQFKVTQLERNKYGDAMRFKPISVKIGNRTFDLNPFNKYKYAGRNLAAQDKMMLTTSYEVEIAHILRDKLKNKNLTGRALTREVMAVFNGDHIDMTKLNATLESDAALHKSLTGEEITPLQKKIRKRELMFEQLPVTKEEKAEAEALARGNIFTDDRGGLFATIAQGIGSMANSSPAAGLIIKPFVPFTKVVGNVTEYMMDHVPFYGFMRANGLGIVSMVKNRINPELPTAQMGEKGSRLYYEQMGRAWFGTLAFSTAMAVLLGKEEDDFVEISGGYVQEGFKKSGREKVLPPYTLRIGSVMVPYKNIPSLAIPFALIGNINDGLKAKRDEGDLRDRLTAALLLDATANSVLMIKDMSFLDGVQRGTQIMADAASADEKKWAKIGEGAIKTYVGFLTRPLPQNNNAVQQIWKMFDPTSYSQREIKDILAYSAGIQHFVGKPNLDQFGDAINTYPGETLLPYTHWLGIKKQDPRWQFLASHNAIPNKIYNKTMLIETGDGLEKRQMEPEELFDFTKRTGFLFSESLKKYMGDTEKVAKRDAETVERQKGNGDLEKISGVREDIEKLWSKATDNAEMELFRWGSVKEEMPKEWELIKKHQAYQLYQTSKETGDYKWSKSELYEMNNMASLRYAQRISTYLSAGYVEEDKKNINKDGVSAFQRKLDKEWKGGAGYKGAKEFAADRMASRIKASIRELKNKQTP